VHTDASIVDDIAGVGKLGELPLTTLLLSNQQGMQANDFGPTF